MGAMTKSELEQYIKEIAAPLAKEVCGKEIGDLIRQNLDTALAPFKAKQIDWEKRLLGGNGGEPALEKRESGLAFARFVRAQAAAKMEGGGPEAAISVLRRWGDGDLADSWAQSRQKALAAGDATAGGFLVPTQFSQEVIELLRASAVVRSLNPTVVPMPVGSIRVPKITAGSSATYVGENVNITKTEPTTGQIILSFKKLAALVPISNDLVRYSSPQADVIVRNDLIRAMAEREDKGFIRDDGTASTPKGILFWVASANKFNANATTNLDNVTADLGKAIQLLMDANITLVLQQHPEAIDVRPGWLFAPRTYKYLTTVRTTNGPYAFRDEMLRGTLWGWPFRVTTQVPTNEGSGTDESRVYFGAFAHAVIGDSLGMIVDASQEAAYHDGSAVVAAYSQDQTVVRVIAEHDFALRYDKAFALIEAVKWGA